MTAARPSPALPPNFLTGPRPATALVVGDVDTYGSGAVVRRLPGAQMRTLSALFDVVAAGWGFPAYFGRNKDAFDDSFSDLPAGMRTAAGASAAGFLTIIDDADQLLADASGEDYEWFATSPEHWRSRQRRAGSGFGIVLVTPTDTAATVLAERWEATGGELIRLRQD